MIFDFEDTLDLRAGQLALMHLKVIHMHYNFPGLITFHLKRRTPEDMALRRWKSGPLAGETSYDPSPIGDPVSQDMLPILIEVNPGLLCNSFFE